jgi:nicotinamidase/pyrazinamidase
MMTGPAAAQHGFARRGGIAQTTRWWLERDFLPGRSIVPDAMASFDAYSDFEGTPLADWLHKLGIRRLLIGGIATDYCVKASVLDALREGFEVLLLVDAIRPVDVQPGDGARAEQAMVQAGARPIRYEQLAGEDA